MLIILSWRPKGEAWPNAPPKYAPAHEEATVSLLFWTNPHPLWSWSYSKPSNWRLTFSQVNLLLVRSHQAEIILAKRFIQVHNNVTRVRIELRLYDQDRRKNDAFTLSGCAANNVYIGTGADLCWALGEIICNFTPNLPCFQHWGNEARPLFLSREQTNWRPKKKSHRKLKSICTRNQVKAKKEKKKMVFTEN